MLETIQSIISDYGYYAIFLFACIEGEIALMTAGVLAKLGFLSLPIVIFVAFSGTVIFEQLVYFIGRLYGRRILKNFPSVEAKAKRAMAFLRKYDTLFIIGYRFIYGIRNISPLIIGMANVGKAKYAVLNILASIIWASSIASLGYFFANTIEATSGGLQIFQKAFLLVLVISILPAIFIRVLKNRKKK